MYRMKAAKDVSKVLSRVRPVLASRETRVTEGGERRAAVLVPFFQRGGELHVLFTRRARTLTRHKGQNRYGTDGRTHAVLWWVTSRPSGPAASQGDCVRRRRALSRQR